MNRLCTLHARPSFPKPRPLAGAFFHHRGGAAAWSRALDCLTVAWWGSVEKPGLVHH